MKWPWVRRSTMERLLSDEGNRSHKHLVAQRGHWEKEAQTWDEQLAPHMKRLADVSVDFNQSRHYQVSLRFSEEMLNIRHGDRAGHDMLAEMMGRRVADELSRTRFLQHPATPKEN